MRMICTLSDKPREKLSSYNFANVKNNLAIDLKNVNIF